MEVQVAETGPCSRSLHITVPPALVDQHLEQMYVSAQRQVQLKGFRPGKVPRALIQKHFGDSILNEAKEQLLNRYFGEACRAKELAPVGRVAIDDFEQLRVQPGSELRFVAKIDVRPAVEIGDTKGLEVEAFEAEATTADVDNALQEVVHQKRSIQPSDAPAQDGDFVKADIAFVDAAGTRVHERRGTQLNTRIPVHGVADDDWSKAVLGAAPGSKLEVPIRFPDTFEKEAVRGSTGSVQIAVHEVLRVAPPPIDDRLAAELGFADVAALRADLHQRISQEKQRLGRLRQEEQCLQQLLDRHAIPVPPSLVEEQQSAALNNYGQRLRENGASDEEVQKRLEESRDEAQQDAQRRVRLFFLIEAVAKQQKIFVTETDVEQELRAIAAANSNDERQVTAAQVREHLEHENRLGELRLGLLERKVRNFLRENARVVDKKGG
ncbi:MAG: trigger factor [Planctomycetes bacterium]|nr:trigger factor [Planctomycetota bacterium]